ncbi:MAG TPA: cob(I)yrinic acid a,c-diamide adenosyltransferase [Kofleriaceae bacterium]|nr:cob(I)yrinic acid a,c-diamide adenosyltransferase [Kofleriaceae bacterium]
MVRINRVYTKAGDQGDTSLVGGDKVSKASARVECYGVIDELNAAIGLVRTALAAAGGTAAAPTLLPILGRVQNELFNLGAELATPDAERRARSPRIEPRHVTALEEEIDQLNEDLPELRSFVLPGGGWTSSYLHLARTICRRGERLVVALAASGEEIGDQAVPYLNRLSDALFVFGRWAALVEGESEPLWEPEKT